MHTTGRMSIHIKKAAGSKSEKAIRLQGPAAIGKFFSNGRIIYLKNIKSGIPLDGHPIGKVI